jgi:hypothetical protein
MYMTMGLESPESVNTTNTFLDLVSTRDSDSTGSDAIRNSDIRRDIHEYRQ